MTKNRRTESATEGICGTAAVPKTGDPAAGRDGANTPEAQLRGHDADPKAGGAAFAPGQAVDNMTVQRKAMEEIQETLQGLVEAVEATGRLMSFLGGRGKPTAEGDSADDPLEKAAQRIEEQVRVYTADFHRWQEINRRVPARLRAAFAAVSFVAVFSLGVLVEQRWQPIPVQDDTGGWKNHVWQHYGRQVADCYRGIGEKAADGSCVVIVRQKR